MNVFPTRRRQIPVSTLIFASWVAIGGLATLIAQNITQSITLHPGWNAVWLEVEPESNTPNEVFADLPVESVWTWLDPESPAEFIQSVTEAAFDAAGWQRWFPAGRPEAVLTNLFRIQVNRPYLIKFGGSAPVEWAVTGRPSLRRPNWRPDDFNLRGLPVDPDTAVNFLDYLRHSPAHYDEDTGLQPIYRLNRTLGAWEEVAPSDSIESGEAYWIFTKGGSDYLAPLAVEVRSGDGLDFGDLLGTLELTISSYRGSPSNAILSEDTESGASILSYEVFDPEMGTLWPHLPAGHPVALDSMQQVRLRLAVRRQDQTTAAYESILTVTDGAGTRLLIPVRSEYPGQAADSEVAQAPRFGPVEEGSGLVAPSAAGLWVGEISLNAVSEVHSETDSSTPTSVDNEFRLRAILHVDAAGQVRLLEEVIQMFRPGTTRTGEGGGEEVETPGEYVLLTEHESISQFQGAGQRDGEPIGRRVSTIGFDFAAPGDDHTLPLSGTLAIGASLTGTLDLPSDHPTNPFLHRYHPDHDNLGPRYDNDREEAFAVQRTFEFECLPSPPEGPVPPDFGFNTMAGNYRETITGIHRHPIAMAGTFRLVRVSTIDVLNPQP